MSPRVLTGPTGPGAAGVVFRQFVVKIAGRCDLACDHCYVFEHADQSWRGRPTFMAEATGRAVAERVAEHAAAHALARVKVILHGGEPLLAGVERIRTLIQQIREALPAGCAADIRIQTNGLQLDEAFCELFLAEGVGVGVSIDGDRAANDRHRRHADGRTSYPELVRAIRLLGSPRYRPLFNGLLCTIDVENDPVAVFDALAAFDPPRLEFLLPHATWVNPPPGALPGEARYAEWLLAVHRRWAERGRPMEVRLFDSVGDLLAGRSSRTESIGLGPADVVVVETDGEIEQADSLKTAYDGAPATGFHVRGNSFDEAATHPGFDARTAEAAALGPSCQRCPILRICGGGLYAHRYDGTGFANPSVYCHDLYTFITGLAGEGRRASRPAPIPAPVPARPKHRMTSADFTALGQNQGTASAMAALKVAQVSWARLKLSHWAEPARATPGWAVVQDFDAHHRAVLNRVLTDPFVFPADGNGSGRSANSERTERSANIVAAIALSCAVLSSTPARIELDVPGNALTLPAVGTLATEPGRRLIEVHAGSAITAITAITIDGLAAEPVRHEARMGPIRLRLEDLDPARDRFGHPVTGPLSPAELAAWQDGLDAAAEVLAKRHPEALAEMTETLTTVVPLRPRPGRHLSATARSAFGALGIALPEAGSDDPGEALACLLLHEFQHLKLGAVLDMFKLHDKSDRAGYPVGWRPDPRSLEAVLQGVYAHTAVVEYWRRRALATRRSEGGPFAQRAADLAGQVESALTGIRPSPALTPPGRQWVAAMASVTARWR